MISVGDRVRIGRDEVLYPSKGTWPRFRGKTGTVVEIHSGEYGVSFGTVRPGSPRSNRVLDWETEDVAWFQPYELKAVGK